MHSVALELAKTKVAGTASHSTCVRLVVDRPVEAKVEASPTTTSGDIVDPLVVGSAREKGGRPAIVLVVRLVDSVAVPPPIAGTQSQGSEILEEEVVPLRTIDEDEGIATGLVGDILRNGCIVSTLDDDTARVRITDGILLDERTTVSALVKVKRL